MVWGGRREGSTIVAGSNDGAPPMLRLNDSRRSLLALEQESTLIVVIELSQSSWLVAGIVPGLERHPLKKLEPDEDPTPAAAAVAG